MNLPSAACNVLAALSDQRPRLHPGQCRRSGNARSICDACKAHCPASCITLSTSGPQIDERCVGCDACVAVCENDAFSRVEEPDLELLLRLVRLARDASVGVSCGASAPGVVAVKCIARMSWLLLLHCAVSGVNTVSFDMTRCSSCTRLRGLGHLARDIALATHLAPALGASLRVTTSTASLDLAAGPQRRTFARRALLDFLRSAAPELSRRVPLFSPGTTLRDALVTMMLTRLETSPEPLPDNWPFGRVTIDPAHCDGCKACSAVCRSRALLRETRGDLVQLLFDPAKCNRCGECAAVCRLGALALDPARLEFVGLGPSTLAVVRGRRCMLCGTTVVGSAEGPCRLCQGASSRLRGARLRID